MMFLEGKVKKFLGLLDDHRYHSLYNDFKIYFSEGEHFDAAKLKEVRIRDRWGAYDQYAWVKIDFKLPDIFKNQPNKLVMLDFGVTGSGNNTAFEAQCFLNGEIYQGVDSNHKEVFLPASCMEGEIRLKLWAGLNGGNPKYNNNLLHEIHQAHFAILDKPVDDLFFLVKAISQTLARLDKNSKTYNDLAAVVELAYNNLPLNDVDGLRANAQHVYETLVANLSAIPDLKNIVIRCIGHTHIDVAWLWRLKHTREKSMRSFSTVMRLMERYPNYLFFQSQPQLYQYIKEDAPELYAEIKKQVAEKRWEPNGAMWVEADCNLTSGESLVRQLLYGRKFFKDEFNVTSNCLWLPDVFGYSAALPQILRKSGIDTFMTTKISWNQYNRIPNDTFYWRGIDGSEVLTHFVTTPTDPTGNYWFYTYNGEINSGTVNGIWDGYKNKELNNELLLSYGFGDGGGGVTREMLEMIDKLAIVPGNNAVKTGFAGEFFDELHAKVADKKVNVWDGELYLEYHRGTYTSQAKTKKYNRKLEYLLRNAEITSAYFAPNAYPSELYEGEWKKLLTNQFHDILPGSSINEVYVDAESTYAEIEQTINKTIQDTLAGHIKSAANVWTVMNYNNFATVEIVTINTDKQLTFTDAQGAPLRSQRIAKGYAVEIHVKPLQTTVIKGVEASQVNTFIAANCTANSIENSRYKISWNANGKLTEVFDKTLNRQMLEEGGLGNDLTMYEDLPRQYDAWELEPYYEDKATAINNLISCKLIESGDLVQVVEFTWQFGRSSITQQMTLSESSPRIDFVTHVNWHEDNTILRTSFPLNIRSTTASFDIQYGNIERPTHRNTAWDFAKFEVSAHKWGDISQRDCGVALLNDSKYGYNASGNVLGLSLLKSATMPDATADRGDQYFTYSILSHAKDWFAGNVEQEAQSLNNPLLVLEGELTIPQAFGISAENVVIDAIKRAEDGQGWIVRLHEFGGQDANLELKPNLPFSTWCETNLMEENLAQLTADAIHLQLTPYEVKTIRLV